MEGRRHEPAVGSRLKPLSRGEEARFRDPSVGAYSASRLRPQTCATRREKHMSKGMDRKKETKKKPAKTMKEKKAEKRDKKATKGFMPA